MTSFMPSARRLQVRLYNQHGLDPSDTPRDMEPMDKRASPERVKRWRDKMRAAGLRPVQFWIPDTNSSDFAAEIRRQCQSLAKAERTGAGWAEAEFWERVSADTWDHLRRRPKFVESREVPHPEKLATEIPA
jgi:hypothetical protein